MRFAPLPYKSRLTSHCCSLLGTRVVSIVDCSDLLIFALSVLLLHSSQRIQTDQRMPNRFTLWRLATHPRFLQIWGLDGNASWSAPCIILDYAEGQIGEPTVDCIDIHLELTMCTCQHFLALFLSAPQMWDPEALTSWQQVHVCSVGKDDVVSLGCYLAEPDFSQCPSLQSLAFAGFLLSPRILHDIHGIYIDVAQSSAQLQRLLRAWNLFAHISHLIGHS